MVPPLLKLAFVQGPRDGESLEYKPGSTIRIGRIVRGNEIVVKDAGVSTKHLRIVSDSENWIVHDLGSSNGTILNSEPLDSDTPVILRHGDVIKLGECTSIVVNFETDAQVEEEEHKLPPRPRRNNRRLRRVGRPRKNEKKVAVMKEEEEAVPVEKKGNSKAKSFDLNPIKLEIEDTRIGVEISEMKRGTRSSRQMRNECLGLEENVKCEDTVIEEKRRPSRATRSKKEAIGGDSFLELEMVLNQAKKSRAKKKKTEQKSVSNEAVIETSDGGCEEEGKAEQGSRNDKNVEKVDLEKMTLGDWFEYMKVHLRKQIVDKTEMMIEDMRSKSLRVRHHIAEQKQAKEEGSVN
ncbi:unnamed protein product [Brassica napus]|uniref:(rape) hypothetical protein n=1 Tax=Brassica napus TaxID=3708 RepID=A0A816U295_BRANA|nr:unnamed protein product [Brassica napus]